MAEHPSDEARALSASARQARAEFDAPIPRAIRSDILARDPALRETEPGVAPSLPQSTARELAPPVEHWERYEFQGLLGSGGMGTVYRARDRQLGRTVALKFIRGDNPTLIARFFLEAQAQARIEHPNLCRIYEVGHVEGKPYIAMQYVEGVPLDSLSERLTLHERASVIRDAARALHEVHRIGIVHRDIKPSNIMIERLPDGTPRPIVMDFGLAHDSSNTNHLTETGAVVGTPAFMSPEQARGNSRHLDRRADIYSLGATLYELFTGRPPFSGAQVVDVILAVLGEIPKSPRDLVPSLPADLEIITLKCLEKDPGQRYDSARALADDLQRYIDGNPILGRPPSVLYRARRFAQRNRGLLLLGIFAALIIFSLLGIGVRMELDSRGRAKLAHELGQDIKEIELFMRAAYSLPLHDIAREQGVVRQRMAELSTQLLSADASSASALRYALGRGHLVLREYPEAQDALERAWAGGYLTADARLALGLALGERYRQEREKAQRTGDRKWRESRERELSERYLKPALRYLERTESGIETSTYIQGLLAFYRQEYDVALRLAQQSQAEAPWLAGPIKLEGDVHQARGIKLLERGQSREARELLVLAAARHQAASTLSRSDAEIYEAESVDWIRIMEIDDESGTPLAESMAAALRSTSQALAASPGHALGYQLRSWTYWRAGFAKMMRGQDPEPDFQRAIELAERATGIGAGDWQSHYYHALAVAGLADTREARGEDADPLNKRAIEALKRAIQLNPNFSWSWNDLGLRRFHLFVNETQHGIYHEELFSDAQLAFRHALRIDPDYANAHNNLLALYIEELDYLAQHGASITETLALARDSAQKAMALKQDDSILCLSSVNIELRAFEHLMLVEPDPRTLAPRSDQLGQQLERCRALNPEMTLFDQDHAWLYLLRAQAARYLGMDPQGALDQGLRAVEIGKRRDAENGDLLVIQARLHMLAGLTRRGRAASEERTRAVAAAEQAVALRPRYAEAHDLLCEALRTVAAGGTETSAPLHGERSALIERGLRACEIALAINPARATALANRGALLLLTAQKAASASVQRASAALAVQALERALQINRWLQRPLAPLLADARRHAQASDISGSDR